MSPVTLDRAVIAYDQTTSALLSKQLHINIARARHHQPIHFTGVSNIAATFNFQFNAGATPALTGGSGGMITPIFGASVAENPTITIVPIEGEDFTRRLLTPFQESKLTMLLRQCADIDLVLRLLAGEFRKQGANGETAYHNKPSDRGYPLFRRLVLHLSSIQDRNSLYVEPLMFENVSQPALGNVLTERKLRPRQFRRLSTPHVLPDFCRPRGSENGLNPERGILPLLQRQARCYRYPE